MSIYKGFEINTSSTPAPWGDREERMVKAVIDTLTVDTLQGTSALSGHSHNKLYATSGSTIAVQVTSAGNVGIGTIVSNGGKVTIEKSTNNGSGCSYSTNIKYSVRACHITSSSINKIIQYIMTTMRRICRQMIINLYVCIISNIYKLSM